jgi:translation initiation factor eIF-2B subunit beta
VFADGSILAKSGSLGLALAAKVHNVPVVVISGIFKFAPVYLSAGDQWTTLDIKTPDQVLAVDQLLPDPPPASKSNLSSVHPPPTPGQIEVINPYYDHVPAHLISLFITNLLSLLLLTSFLTSPIKNTSLSNILLDFFLFWLLFSEAAILLHWFIDY